MEADKIFKEFQEHANNGSLPFRRFPMKSHICESTSSIRTPPGLLTILSRSGRVPHELFLSEL